MIVNPYNAKKEVETLNLAGLLCYLNFESNALDSYGPYNATEVNSPSYGTGRIGSALTPVGGVTPEYVYIPDNSVFSFTDGAGNDKPFSVSCWAYSSNTDEQGWFVNKRAATPDEWNFITNNGSFFLTLFGDGDTSNYIGTEYPDFTMPTSEWVHFAGTYDGSNTPEGIKLYIDGERVISEDVLVGTYGGMDDTASDVYIGVGGFVPAGPYTFEGEIDLVQIWARELSASEIKLIYDTENSGNLITG